MIDLQQQASQPEISRNLYQDDVSIKNRDVGHLALASIIPPRPSHLPLGGPRTIEFLGFRTGKNRFNRNTISLDFIDLNTQQVITRTINIVQNLGDRSYFVKFISRLVGGEDKLKEAAKGGGEALGILINEQRGNRYSAECEPSKTGMHTNIIDFLPLEISRIDPKGRKEGSTALS